MKVLIDFCLVPMGDGVSVSAQIAEVQRELADSGLLYRMHSFGTSVEGEWSRVFEVLERCHRRVHAMGCVRIHTTVRIGTRTDRAQGMDDKVSSVERRLAKGDG
jgi:uncharacterized protein (TIGR00106 family)